MCMCGVSLSVVLQNGVVSPVCACVACHCLLSYSLGRSLQCVHVWRVTVCCLIVWGGLSSVCMCGVSLSIVL